MRDILSEGASMAEALTAADIDNDGTGLLIAIMQRNADDAARLQASIDSGKDREIAALRAENASLRHRLWRIERNVMRLLADDTDDIDTGY